MSKSTKLVVGCNAKENSLALKRRNMASSGSPDRICIEYAYAV
jgi:hypothetical protein